MEIKQKTSDYVLPWRSVSIRAYRDITLQELRVHSVLARGYYSNNALGAGDRLTQ